MAKNDPFTKALMVEAKKKKWKPEGIQRVKDFLDKTAYVESKGNAKAKQTSGGPGRGKYQFQLGASSKSAKQRLRNWERSRKVKLPLSEQDEAELDKEEPDFSKLSERAQDAIALINYTMKPSSDVMSKVAEGSVDEGEVWADLHWAGDKKDKEAKLAQWDREVADRAKRKRNGQQKAAPSLSEPIGLPEGSSQLTERDLEAALMEGMPQGGPGQVAPMSPYGAPNKTKWEL